MPPMCLLCAAGGIAVQLAVLALGIHLLGHSDAVDNESDVIASECLHGVVIDPTGTTRYS